jgi:predicted ATP-grasp superfamily ATP-dependent carboligase
MMGQHYVTDKVGAIALDTSPSRARPPITGVTTSPNADRCDALVTQGWGRIAYNIVRSLGRNRLRVAVGTDEFLGMALLSRYTTKSFRHPGFITHTEEFLRSVRDAIIKYSPKVYIPSDQEVLAVARYRNKFNGLGTEIPISSFDTLKMLHKKNELSNLAVALGIPTPATIVPRNHQQLIDFAAQYRDPIVLKRVSSSAARGVTYLDRAALEEYTHVPQDYSLGNVLAQQYVRGVGYGVSMLFNHGELRAKFTHKRLRENLQTGGISTLRMSVANPLLEEYAETILRCVRFHGVAMVEFKYDEERQQAWLIEVNPRFWGSLALAIQAGVDFPFLLYKLATQGDIDPVLEYRKNLTVRWFLGDAMARLRQIKLSSVSGLAGDHTRTDGYDDFYWNDPLPFVGEFIFSALKYRKTRGTSSQETDVALDKL